VRHLLSKVSVKLVIMATGCHVYNLYYSTAPSGGLISLAANERQHERIITLVDGAVRAPSSWRCNDTLKN